MNASYWCSGYANCDDGYDEDPIRCDECKMRPNVTKCEDSLFCITDEWLCNGFPHCLDMSDELSPQYCNRTMTCDTDDMFLCEDGATCISKKSTCDGLNNCPDASDESFELCENEAQVGTFR